MTRLGLPGGTRETREERIRQILIQLELNPSQCARAEIVMVRGPGQRRLGDNGRLFKSIRSKVQIRLVKLNPTTPQSRLSWSRCGSGCRPGARRGYQTLSPAETSLRYDRRHGDREDPSHYITTSMISHTVTVAP